MVVGGVPGPRSDNPSVIAFRRRVSIAAMALDMQQAREKTIRETSRPLSIGIAIDSGPVVAGVIGLKKFIYNLWGDRVKTASRGEAHHMSGCIQVAESAYTRLRDRHHVESRGTIEVKGKGMIRAYLPAHRQKTLVTKRLQPFFPSVPPPQHQPIPVLTSGKNLL